MLISFPLICFAGFALESVAAYLQFPLESTSAEQINKKTCSNELSKKGFRRTGGDEKHLRFYFQKWFDSRVWLRCFRLSFEITLQSPPQRKPHR